MIATDRLAFPSVQVISLMVYFTLEATPLHSRLASTLSIPGQSTRYCPAGDIANTMSWLTLPDEPAAAAYLVVDPAVSGPSSYHSAPVHM